MDGYMAGMPDILNRAAAGVSKHRGMILPLVAMSLILVIIIPLPRLMMDVLLCSSLAMSALILLTALQVSTPLEFSVFPSLLLIATLWRLVLNVASTRLILTAGRDGGDAQEAIYGAGRVIHAFGEFVPSGSLAVGLILFGILVLVQFVVITKGAARISEVAARFALDSMPGKQMAVDAELAGGRIDSVQATRERANIARYSDFYGAMDGASKFLRGDALVGIVITLVNLLGGLYVGMVEYGWTLEESSQLFARLTVGDGLVTQIPAFLISISAALLVSRSTRPEDLGKRMITQLGGRPVVLGLAAGFLGVLLFTPLPKLPLLMLGGGMGLLAWVLRNKNVEPKAPQNRKTPAPAKDVQNVEKLLTVDPVRVDLGFALVRLADADRGGELIDRIAQLRSTLAEELGLIVGPVRIRDDMRLESHAYAVFLRGAKVASGRLYPNQHLAVGPEASADQLQGRVTVEPVFSTPAVWIGRAQHPKALALGCSLIEPVSVLVAHLGEVIRAHAPELLNRRHVVRMLDGVKATTPGLVEELTSKLSMATIQKVLQNLLAERVSIRDFEMILESISDAVSTGAQDADEITERVRASMGRLLSQQYASPDGKLWCVSLDSSLEETLCSYVSQHGSGIPADVNTKVAKSVASRLDTLQKAGRQAVVLCSPPLRPALRKMLSDVAPRSAVLGYNEVELVEVNSVATVGADES